MHATRRRIATFAAVPAFAGFVLALTGGTENRALTGGTTVALTLTNDTDTPMTFVSAANPRGRWVDAPPMTIAPHTSVSISAWSNDLRGVSFGVRYATASAEAVFSAGNRTPYGADIAGTRIEDSTGESQLAISTRIDTCYPTMTLEYHVHRVRP